MESEVKKMKDYKQMIIEWVDTEYQSYEDTIEYKNIMKNIDKIVENVFSKITDKTTLEEEMNIVWKEIERWNMKNFIVEYCEDMNKNNEKYKITYWELFDTYFNLYIENIVDEIEYQVEISISDLNNKDKQERYLIINDIIKDYLYSCGD